MQAAGGHGGFVNFEQRECVNAAVRVPDDAEELERARARLVPLPNQSTGSVSCVKIPNIVWWGVCPGGTEPRGTKTLVQVGSEMVPTLVEYTQGNHHKLGEETRGKLHTAVEGEGYEEPMPKSEAERQTVPQCDREMVASVYQIELEEKVVAFEQRGEAREGIPLERAVVEVLLEPRVVDYDAKLGDLGDKCPGPIPEPLWTAGKDLRATTQAERPLDLSMRISRVLVGELKARCPTWATILRRAPKETKSVLYAMEKPWRFPG